MSQGADIFRALRNKRDTAGSLEMERICRLPVVLAPTTEEIDAFCREYVVAEYYDRGFRLFSTQVGAVLAYILYGGIFGPVGVGWGKTLITLMVANLAPELYGIERSMLFVPPQVYSQLTRTDIGWGRKRVGLTVPFILMGNRGLAERASIAASGKRGCYVLPYTYLSTRDAEDLLQQIRPQLLILDEAHNVKNRRAARTKRLTRYMERAQPQLVGLSGTITSKSIRDYHHLISNALGEWSPLPLSPSMAEGWAQVLDANADFECTSHTGDLTPLLNWASYRFPDVELRDNRAGYRKAFNLRLTTAPGVVATGDAEIGVSLLIENQPVADYKQAEGWERCAQLMKDVTELWRAPNGDEIEYGFHQWRHLYELTAGFYYDLRWPTPEQIQDRRRLSLAEAEVYLEQAQAHHLALQEYHRVLRRFLEYGSRAKLDTPLLVANSMAQHGAEHVWPELYERWTAAKDLEFPGMPTRDSIPTEVCDYKVKAIIRWANEHGKGLVWYHHDYFGRWCARELERAGVDVLWCPAEGVRKGSNDNILDTANKDRIIVASMGGHGTGKNLQHFQNQVFGEFPRQAPLAEQVLGRTHRNGQEADELLIHTLNTLAFDDQNMSACLNDALYQHQTVGARQKLIYASYEPVPKVYPPDFLRERGFVDLKHLDRDAIEFMKEKFGEFEGL